MPKAHKKIDFWHQYRHFSMFFCLFFDILQYLCPIIKTTKDMQQKANKESGAEGAQIDLVLDRRDQVINLCEMKYSLKPYDITPIYLQKLLDRRETFREANNTNKALHLTLVTASGLKKNAQAGMIQSEIVLDDLFQEKS